MNFFNGLSLIALIILFEGCVKEKINPITKSTPYVNDVGDSPIIYVAGETKHASVVWRNGFADTLAFSAVAQSVYVEGNDTYVAGWISNGPFDAIAMYWKNGDPINLSDHEFETYAKSIAVSNNDVYVAGFELNSQHKARCWKNGIPIQLDLNDALHSYAVSIFVSGDDVYVAGWVLNLNGKSSAVYWKNGRMVLLTDGSSDSMAESIFVTGQDVYVVGTIDYSLSHIAPNEVFAIGKQGVATYWKNGNATTLSDNGRAQSIFVNGSDVYVCGSISTNTTLSSTPFGAVNVIQAVYWKNGDPVILDTDFNANSDANAISVTRNGDVYTAGWIGNHAASWINDSSTHFPISTEGNGYLYSIFLTN